MTTESKNVDDVPVGTGNGDTDTNAPDTTSGGAPEQPSSSPGGETPSTEEPDGTPVENPSGG